MWSCESHGGTGTKLLPMPLCAQASPRHPVQAYETLAVSQHQLIHAPDEVLFLNDPVECAPRHLIHRAHSIDEANEEDGLRCSTMAWTLRCLARLGHSQLQLHTPILLGNIPKGGPHQPPVMSPARQHTERQVPPLCVCTMNGAVQTPRLPKYPWNGELYRLYKHQIP